MWIAIFNLSANFAQADLFGFIDDKEPICSSILDRYFGTKVGAFEIRSVRPDVTKVLSLWLKNIFLFWTIVEPTLGNFYAIRQFFIVSNGQNWTNRLVTLDRIKHLAELLDWEVLFSFSVTFWPDQFRFTSFRSDLPTVWPDWMIYESSRQQLYLQK